MSLTHVVDLTDEEIAGLDGPGEHVAPLPWLATRPPTEHELVAEVGLRGLLARGLVALTGDDLTLETDDPAAAVLALRRHALAIVYAEHSAPSRQSTRVLYVHADGVLTEDVDALGIHRFSVGDRRGSVDALAAWCVPDSTDTDRGRAPDEIARRVERPVPSGEDDLDPRLEGLSAVVALDLVYLHEEDVQSRSCTFYRVPSGILEGQEDDRRLTLEPLEEHAVHSRVRALLALDELAPERSEDRPTRHAADRGTVERTGDAAD